MWTGELPCGLNDASRGLRSDLVEDVLHPNGMLNGDPMKKKVPPGDVHEAVHDVHAPLALTHIESYMSRARADAHTGVNLPQDLPESD